MWLAVLILSFVSGVGSPARAGYNAANDFSPTVNPNGVWSYGWSSTLGSPFIADVVHQNFSSLDFWAGGIPSSLTPGAFPDFYHNGTSGTIDFGGTVLVAPNQLVLHPGPDGEYADLRFTTPTAGTFLLSSTFMGADSFGTTTDVHILLDGTSIFDGLINGTGATTAQNFIQSLSLKAGDTLDFVVGYGTNKNFYNDSTALSVNLSNGTVPEPSSLVLMGVGGLTWLGVRRWRTRTVARS
jgi:hypothetical protein